MSDVTYYGSKEILNAFGRDIIVSNFTRPNHDGTLPKSVPGGLPYYPQHFPAGQWKITDPLPRTAADLAPWYIPTDAHQMVPEWSLKPDGTMDNPDAFPFVGSSGGVCSHNSPACIVPQRGKVTKNSVKPPNSECWAVLHEYEWGLYLANDPGKLGP